MYYRRKILLALLDTFGSKLGKIDLQKLLFLFTRSYESPPFHFVPYKYGVFSFQANADLNTMIKYNQVVSKSNSWIKVENKNYLKEIKNEDRINLIKLKNKFKPLTTDELIKYTYINYPFYAINSQVAKDKLCTKDYNLVLKSKPKKKGKIIYTIGYESITVEEYFIKLIKNDIKVLCDVRNYPRSMKYGFSKKQLQNACQNLGIIYVHLPSLGIVSIKRKSLKSQSDYNKLFSEYKETTLKNNLDDQLVIKDLIEKYDRVALTCFEKNIHQCHRIPLSKSIKSFFNKSIELLNI